MKKPRVAFCPADQNNEKFFQQLLSSLRKFHTEEELPLIRYDLKDNNDQHKWYRATPTIARELLKDYEVVIKLDADQIITGSLSDIWEGDFDVATVLNDPNYPIQTWDIKPYFNLGLVVIKNPEFIEHWGRLCYSDHFLKYQFREQDLYNILCSDYHDYKVKCLDGESIYGESAKPLWATAQLVGGKLMAGGKQINIIHFGGGSGDASKGNLKIRFQEDVVKWLDQLIK